jgi:hypothetical protein
MPWKRPVHRPPSWQDKRARDRDYGIFRDKAWLALMRSGAWRKARVAFLAEHPFCAGCGASATVVDHALPHRGAVALAAATRIMATLRAAASLAGPLVSMAGRTLGLKRKPKRKLPPP